MAGSIHSMFLAGSGIMLVTPGILLSRLSALSQFSRDDN